MEDLEDDLIENADLIKGRASRALIFKRYKQGSKLKNKVDEEKRKRENLR